MTLVWPSSSLSMNRCENTDAVTFWFVCRTLAQPNSCSSSTAPMANTKSGNSRNSRLSQKLRTLPLRSSDAGTMYPLTMKKTSTPYSPGSNTLYTARWTAGSTRVPKWLYTNTTQRAAIPRSASSQASLRPPAFARSCAAGCGSPRAGAGRSSRAGAAAVAVAWSAAGTVDMRGQLTHGP